MNNLASVNFTFCLITQYKICYYYIHIHYLSSNVVFALVTQFLPYFCVRLCITGHGILKIALLKRSLAMAQRQGCATRILPTSSATLIAFQETDTPGLSNLCDLNSVQSVCGDILPHMKDGTRKYGYIRLVLFAKPETMSCKRSTDVLLSRP